MRHNLRIVIGSPTLNTLTQILKISFTHLNRSIVTFLRAMEWTNITSLTCYSGAPLNRRTSNITEP
ncbi:hypothetical protein FM109_01410 [Vibrio casei]|nr:hypothetical protein FM109_01410 [Vibrio casei]